MNPIAQQALTKARQSIVPAGKPAPKSTPAKAAPSKVQIAIAGKPAQPTQLDLFGYREGRNYAIDTINSMPALLKRAGGPAEIAQNLKRAATGRPVSQALGIWSIIEMLEAA